MTLTPVQVTPLGHSTTASSGTLTLTFGSAVTAGNTVVVVIGTGQTTTNPTVSGITLGGNADHFASRKSLNNNVHYDAEIWSDPTVGVAGATAVAVSYSGGTGASADIWAIAYEVPGTLALDQTQGQDHATATTFTSLATAATTVANEIFFGAVSGGNTLVATGAGTWTTLQGTGGAVGSFLGGYQIVSATGTCTFSGTQASDSYTAVVATFYQLIHAGTAGLSGSGTLSGAGVFAGTAALSGTGTLSGAATGIFTQAATLDGIGTLGGAWTGTLAQPPATLSGAGTLQLSGVKLGFTAGLSGNGTLSVLQATGGLVFASPGAATPYAYPLSSQVMVAPPGTSAWTPLGSAGVVTALSYSFTCPGGADKMSCTVMVPAAYRSQLFNPGWQVKITRGGHAVWTGRMDEPAPTPAGWAFTAAGDGNRGQDFLAIYTAAWPSGQPDTSINGAVSRGLPWANPGVGTPPGAWYGQQVDSGAQTVTALLNLICTRGGLTWMANSQPGGQPGTDLTVFPLPTVPNRLLISVSPVPRTLGGDINTIFIRYQVTADTTDGSGNSIPATFAVTSVQNAASATAHGVTETFIDLSDAGVMTAAAAQAVGNSVLQIYQRASFAGPFTARYGQLTNPGGVPVDPGTDQAGTMVKLILCDFGYGGEVSSATPVQFIVGAYEWDDLSQTATITPYQNVDQSLTGLLSLANTELMPITVVG